MNEYALEKDYSDAVYRTNRVRWGIVAMGRETVAVL